MIDLDNVIIVCVGNEKLIGELRGIPADGSPITFRNVRRLLITLTPRTDSRGDLSGIKLDGAIIPIDLLSGPVPEMTVNPSYYYRLSADVGVRKKFESMLKACDEQETQMRATNAGIIVR